MSFCADATLTNVTYIDADNSDRKGPWEEIGRDRVRFEKRIKDTEKILAPVLGSSHREYILRSRNAVDN